MSSAAVMIGALRVKILMPKVNVMGECTIVNVKDEI